MLNCQHHISWIQEVPGGLHQCILCTAVVTKKDISPKLEDLPEAFRLRWEAHEATRPPEVAAAAPAPAAKPAVAAPAPRPAQPSAPKPDVAAKPEVVPAPPATPRPAIPRVPPMRPGIPPPAASWDPTSHR